ncbi:MAG TPA: hypothetical protein VK858_21240, partial [Longimicrobiales bacterium]|nr:hypothetical protein [Longimicrobiales bacterium]
MSRPESTAPRGGDAKGWSRVDSNRFFLPPLPRLQLSRGARAGRDPATHVAVAAPLLIARLTPRFAPACHAPARRPGELPASRGLSGPMVDSTESRPVGALLWR